MRAIKLDLDLNIGEIQEIGGDKAHHFIKVVRLKEGEKILALNGDGRKDLLAARTNFPSSLATFVESHLLLAKVSLS